MLFEPKAVVSAVLVHKSYYKKAKPKPVAAREFCSLSYRLSGKIRLTSADGDLVSSENCVTFMPAGVSYTTEIIEDGEMIVVHFYVIKPYKDLTPEVIDIEKDTDIKNLFFELHSVYTSEGENKYLLLSKFYSLLLAIDSFEHTLVPRRMRHAKNYIDKNYNEALSVSSLAYASGLSEVYFRNEFKKFFGLSPVAYIKKLRIDIAKQLLLSGKCSISDVATECGFESISYFSYEFRRKTRLTPSEYIKKYKGL